LRPAEYSYKTCPAWQDSPRFGVLAGLFYSKLRAAIDLEKII